MAEAAVELTTASEALVELRRLANPEKAALLQRFFRTGPGQYAEGDVFLGLMVPVTRAVMRRCALPLSELEILLDNRLHEARLLALLCMVRAYERGSPRERAAIYRSYLRHTRHVNNWDLVDLSAPRIVGAHLSARSRAPLLRLARSPLLWERRIAMVSTLAFIVNGEADDALRIAELLLEDEHDLMHKAVGWMLREVGKRCGREHLVRFLERHAAHMPRTALRYSLEHFGPRERERYMRMGRPGRVGAGRREGQASRAASRRPRAPAGSRPSRPSR